MSFNGPSLLHCLSMMHITEPNDPHSFIFGSTWPSSLACNLQATVKNGMKTSNSVYVVVALASAFNSAKNNHRKVRLGVTMNRHLIDFF